MKKNMGSSDRTVRIVLAILCVVLYYNHVIVGSAGVLLLVLGGVFVLTSLVSFCPLYTLFGFSTASQKK